MHFAEPGARDLQAPRDFVCSVCGRDLPRPAPELDLSDDAALCSAVPQRPLLAVLHEDFFALPADFLFHRSHGEADGARNCLQPKTAWDDPHLRKDHGRPSVFCSDSVP